MKPEEAELWETYFCRATQWANTMTPGMYDVAIQMLTNLKVGPTLTALGKPVFTRTGRHDVDTVAKYIEDPDKCVQNPYVYNAMHHTTDLDAGWIKTVIRKRTKDYSLVEQKLDSSAHELSRRVKACYSFDDVFDSIKSILEPD
jgi:hypothetical protein